MTQSMPDDGRSQDREDTTLGAMIEVPGKSEMRCLVVNMSPEGAELQLAVHQRVPQHFVLHVPTKQQSYRAEVRWRDQGKVGVTFLGTEALARPRLTAV